MSTAVQTVQIPSAGSYRVDPSKSDITFEAKHLFGLGTVCVSLNSNPRRWTSRRR